MRLIKMLGLVAIPVLVATALIGVNQGVAEPTELEKVVFCAELEDPCAAGNQLGAGTKFHAELAAPNASSILATGPKGEPFKITCKESEFTGIVTEALAEGEISGLEFKDCKNTLDGQGCEPIKAEHQNYTFKGELEEDHKNYRLLVTKTQEEQPELIVKCPTLKIDCKYAANTWVFLQKHDVANEDVVFNVKQDLSDLNGGLCLTVTWDANYLTNCLDDEEFLIGCWLAMEK